MTNELATDPESNKTIQNPSSLPVTHQEHIHSDPGRDTQAQTSIRTYERKPTFHIFKGIPEGHFSCAFTFSSASVFGPSVGISEISVFVKISSSLPSYKLSSELSYMISSSEFNSTSISLRSGGSSPLYILRPSSYLLN